jgi:hypothetical protein
MSSSVKIEIEIPDDLARLRLPDGGQERLHTLLDKQDHGQPLTDSEQQREAEGLVNLADLLSLLRLRAERLSICGLRRAFEKQTRGRAVSQRGYRGTAHTATGTEGNTEPRSHPRLLSVTSSKPAIRYQDIRHNVAARRAAP